MLELVIVLLNPYESDLSSIPQNVHPYRPQDLPAQSSMNLPSPIRHGIGLNVSPIQLASFHLKTTSIAAKVCYLTSLC